MYISFVFQCNLFTKCSFSRYSKVLNAHVRRTCPDRAPLIPYESDKAVHCLILFIWHGEFVFFNFLICAIVYFTEYSSCIFIFTLHFLFYRKTTQTLVNHCVVVVTNKRVTPIFQPSLTKSLTGHPVAGFNPNKQFNK